MEEGFEKKSKFLKILIPIIILVVLIGAGLAYHFISNKPQNIFSKALDKVFESIKVEEHNSLKSNLELSMNIETDNSEIQSQLKELNKVKLKANQEMDLDNKFINEAMVLNFSGNDLLSLELMFKDKTGYAFLEGIFSKYIEIPLEELDEEIDIFEMIEESQRLMSKEVLAECNNILREELQDKNYKQEKEEIIVDGEKIKATKSTLVLTAKETMESLVSVLNKVNKNETIMNAYTNKEKVKEDLQELIKTAEEEIEYADEEGKIEISIYTKGIKKEFVGLDINMLYEDEEMARVCLYKSKDNYKFTMFEEEEELFSIDITEEKEDNYKISMEIEGEEAFEIYVVDQKENENSGKLVITCDMSELFVNMSEEISKFILTFTAQYDIKYDSKIDIPSFSDSVRIDEITEEDMMEMLENLQKTELYTLLEQAGLIDTSELIPDIYGESDFETDEIVNSDPEVTYDNYTVKYNVPNGFIVSTYNTPSYKYYSDNNLNSVTVTIEKETKDNYLEFLKESYTLTAESYQNQEISGIKTLNVGGREFSYRTITYSLEGYNYTEYYYCYELGDGYLYVVEADVEDGTLDETELNKFLEIQI